MSRRPILPPLYRGAALDAAGDAFLEAQARARAGAGAGTLLWSARDDRFDCAVVLEPERPLAESLPVHYVALLGFGDALGALLPPAVDVTFDWPDRIAVNGGTVGGVRLAVPDAEAAATPDWMVVGAGAALADDPTDDEPGRNPGRTTLGTEGGAGIAPVDLVEAFARHFLVWLNRWQDDGFGPVRQAWLKRAAGSGGRVAGLDDSGGLLLIEDGGTRTLDLRRALQGATWLR